MQRIHSKGRYGSTNPFSMYSTTNSITYSKPTPKTQDKEFVKINKRVSGYHNYNTFMPNSKERKTSFKTVHQSSFKREEKNKDELSVLEAIKGIKDRQKFSGYVSNTTATKEIIEQKKTSENRNPEITKSKQRKIEISDEELKEVLIHHKKGTDKKIIFGGHLKNLNYQKDDKPKENPKEIFCSTYDREILGKGLAKPKMEEKRQFGSIKSLDDYNPDNQINNSFTRDATLYYYGNKSRSNRFKTSSHTSFKKIGTKNNEKLPGFIDEHQFQKNQTISGFSSNQYKSHKPQ